MPNDTINIIRPDGSVTSGTRDELKKLQLLGDYKEETATDKKFRESEAATKEMYSGIGDKVKTFASGVASGASLGLLDPLVDTDEEKLRAKYNPKSRLAGEITGGVAPAFIPGGEFAPAGALGKLAGGASELVGGGIKGAAIAGGIEGAGFGAQSTIANSTLTDDPLTAQSLLSGIGYSSLFGAGLNTAIHGAGRLAERAGNKLEVKAADAAIGEPTYKPKSKDLGTVDILEDVHAPKTKDLGEIEVVNPENYTAFRQNIADTAPAKQYIEDYTAAIDSDIAKMKADHGEALSSLDEGVGQAKKRADEIKKKIPEARQEHNAELMQAKNESVLAKHRLDKFNAEAEADIKLTDKQYAKEVNSGGLHTAATRLESTYTEMVKKLNPAAGKVESEATSTLREALDKYKTLVKSGDYAKAHETLTRVAKGMKAVDGAFALGLEIPEVKIGIKAKPGKTARGFKKALAKYEDDAEAADQRLSELKARGPRDYVTEHGNATLEHERLKTERTKYPELDFSQHMAAKEEFGNIGRALDNVKNFPETAAEFRGMGTAKVNRLTESLDLIMKSVDKVPELHSVVSSLEKATQSLIESTGIKAEGSVIEQLKAVQKIAKEANKQPIFGPTEHNVIGQKSVSHDVLGPVEHEIVYGKAAKAATENHGFGDGAIAYGASKVLGAGYPGYLMGKALLGSVEGLAGIKSAVQNKVSRAAKAIGKTFQRTGKNYVVPALQPLYTKLNGGRDKEAKNPREAARNRINELMEITPVVNDTLYKGLEAHAGGVHNAVFAAIHNAAIAGHNALIELLPKDRIGTTVGFKQTWEPNDIETAITAKVLRAFYNPTDVLTDSMAGKLDPIELKTIKAVYPDLYSYVRSEILEQVTLVPELTKSFNNQQALSTLLDIKVSSAFKPENTVDAQAIFVATPEVNNASQGGGAKNNSGGGRPAKTNTGEPPTAAQSLIGK